VGGAGGRLPGHPPQRDWIHAEALLTFYDFPAEHWLHLKTSNPIWVLS
jgi:hypothetical protein